MQTADERLTWRGLVAGLVSRLTAQEGERLQTEEQGAVMLSMNETTIRNLEAHTAAMPFMFVHLFAYLHLCAETLPSCQPQARNKELEKRLREATVTPPRATGIPAPGSPSWQSQNSSPYRPRAGRDDTDLQALKQDMLRTITSLQNSLDK